MAAAVSGKDLEEIGSEDDGLLDLSEDDFFLTGSSRYEANANDEWTDKSTREQASSSSRKAASGMSSDERNQTSDRVLMPPPRPSNKSLLNSVGGKSRFGPTTSRNQLSSRADMSTFASNTSNSRSASFNTWESSNSSTGSHGSNLSTNSDARKPRRKRRPKKKKQQA